MKRVALRFEDGSPGWRHRLFGTGGRLSAGVAVAALLVVAAAWALQATRLAQLRAERARMEADVARIVTMRASPVAAPVLTKAERTAWAPVLRALNTPWDEVWLALEAVTPPEVALLGIEPDPSTGWIRLQAEARSLDVLLAYAASLRASHHFSEVLPRRHDTHDRDPQQPVRLLLDVRPRALAAGVPPAEASP